MSGLSRLGLTRLGLRESASSSGSSNWLLPITAVVITTYAASATFSGLGAPVGNTALNLIAVAGQQAAGSFGVGGPLVLEVEAEAGEVKFAGGAGSVTKISYIDASAGVYKLAGGVSALESFSPTVTLVDAEAGEWKITGGAGFYENATQPVPQVVITLNFTQQNFTHNI